MREVYSEKLNSFIVIKINEVIQKYDNKFGKELNSVVFKFKINDHPSKNNYDSIKQAKAMAVMCVIRSINNMLPVLNEKYKELQCEIEKEKRDEINNR